MPARAQKNLVRLEKEAQLLALVLKQIHKTKKKKTDEKDRHLLNRLMEEIDQA